MKTDEMSERISERTPTNNLMQIHILYNYDAKTQWMYYSVLNWLRDSGFKDVCSIEFQSDVIYIVIEKRSQWYGEYVAIKDDDTGGINYIKDKVKDGSKLEIEIHNKTAYFKDGKLVEENKYWIDIGWKNSKDITELWWSGTGTFRFDSFKTGSTDDLKELKRMKEKLNKIINNIFEDWRG